MSRSDLSEMLLTRTSHNVIRQNRRHNKPEIKRYYWYTAYFYKNRVLQVLQYLFTLN